MHIRLFPEQFLQRDECFGLFKLGEDGELDLPVTVEGDAGIPFHIVHSDPDHLAYLAGLIVLQAWTSGIDELGIPPTDRRPVLVVTDRPGRIYVGLCAPGKSMKTAAMRALASMMHTAERERWARAADAVDPYWTLVYYFNSLCELGGALRLIDDDIRQRLVYLANSDGMTPPRTISVCEAARLQSIASVLSYV